MERTKEREAYFAELRQDPWLATVHAQFMQMWASGYEQAIRDLVRAKELDPEVGYERTYQHEIERRAAEWLTEQEARIKQTVALAMAVHETHDLRAQAARNTYTALSRATADQAGGI